MTTEQTFVPASEAALPVPTVIVVADRAFSDRQSLVDQFDSAVLHFCDLSDPATLSAATSGASGVVVTLQPLRAAHIEALAPSVRVIGRAGVGLDTIDLDAARHNGCQPADLWHQRGCIPCGRASTYLAAAHL